MKTKQQIKTEHEKIVEKIRKLHQLVIGGVGGEKESAKFHLDKLLAKTGLVLEDIVEKKEPCFFKFKSAVHVGLLRQVVAKVLNSRNVECWVARDKKKVLIFELTKLQEIEVRRLGNIYWHDFQRYLREKTRLSYVAFVQKNRIIPEGNGEEGDEDQKIDLEEARRILAEMQGIELSNTQQSLGK